MKNEGLLQVEPTKEEVAQFREILNQSRPISCSINSQASVEVIPQMS